MSRFKPLPFKPIEYLVAGGKKRLFVVFWLLLCLLIIPTGMLTRIFELTGIPINLFGLQLHITVYIPILICVPMCLILGYYWAAIPAYFSTFLVALLGDMPIYWIGHVGDDLQGDSGGYNLTQYPCIFIFYGGELSVRSGRIHRLIYLDLQQSSWLA